MPRVWNKRHQGVPKDAVYVGRPSQWGNPFKVGKDGTREEVIEAFEAYAKEMLKRDPDWLEPLRGKDLVCWCFPEACHADVLIRLANDNSRSFAIKSNSVNAQGFRRVLCEGNLHEDGTVELTRTGNKVFDQDTKKPIRPVPLADSYDSLDALLSALAAEDVRCIYWQDTREYQYINRK